MIEQRERMAPHCVVLIGPVIKSRRMVAVGPMLFDSIGLVRWNRAGDNALMPMGCSNLDHAARQ